MIPDWQVEGYERLRTEIVRSAVNDLKKGIRKSKREGAVCKEQRAMERWFLSAWGQMLCGDNGEYIIERCRATYKAPSGKMWADPVPPEVEEQAHKDYKAGMLRKEIMRKHNMTLYQYWQMLRRFGR